MVVEVDMNQPVDRDQQIAFMTDAERRIREKVSAWVRVPTIKDQLSKPVPGQPEPKRFTVNKVRRTA